METDLSLFKLNNSIFQDTGFVDMYYDTNRTPDFEELQPPNDAFAKEETQNPSAELDKLIESWETDKGRTAPTDRGSGDKLLEEINQPRETSGHFWFSELSKENEELNKGIKELKMQSFDLQSEIAQYEKKLSQTMNDYNESKSEVAYLRQKLESSGKENSLLELKIQQLENLNLQYQRAFIQQEAEEERLPNLKKKIQNQSAYIRKLRGRLKNRCGDLKQLSDQMKYHIKKTWKFMTLFGVKLSKMGLLTDKERSDFLKEFGGHNDFYKIIRIPGIKNISKILQDYSPISSKELSILHKRIDDTSICNIDLPILSKDVQKSIVSSSVPSLPTLDYFSPVENSDYENIEKGLSNSSIVSLVEFDSFDDETGCASFSKVYKASEVEQNQIVSSCSQEALKNLILDQSGSDYNKVNSKIYLESDSMDSCQEAVNSVENQEKNQLTPSVRDHSVDISVKYSHEKSSELNEIYSVFGKALNCFSKKTWNPVNKMENGSLCFDSSSSDESRDNAMDKSNLCKIGFDSTGIITDTYEELSNYKVTDKNNLTDAAVSDASNDIFVDVDQNNSNINEIETGLVKSIIGPCQDILNTKENLLSKNKFNDPCISNHDANHFIDSCDAVDESNLCEKIFDSMRMVTDTCEELNKYKIKDKNNLTAASGDGFINGQNDSNIHEVETEESIECPCQNILSTNDSIKNKDKFFICNHGANHFFDSFDTIDKSNRRTVFESTRRVTEACEELSEHEMTGKNDLTDATLSDACNDSQNDSNINENSCDAVDESNLCKKIFDSTRMVTDTCEELSKYKMTNKDNLEDATVLYTSNDDFDDGQNDSNISEVETEPVESIVGPCQKILNHKKSVQSKNKFSEPCISNHGANHCVDFCGSKTYSCDTVNATNLSEKVFDSTRIVTDTCKELSEHTIKDKNNLTAASSDGFINGQNDSNINEVETEPVESIVGPCQEISNSKESLLSKNEFSDHSISNCDANHFIDSCDTMDESILCKTAFESTRMVTNTCEELSEYKMTNTSNLTDASNDGFIDGQNDSNIHEVETVESIECPCQNILSTNDSIKNKDKFFICNHGANHFFDSFDTINKSNCRTVFESTRRVTEACEELSGHEMTGKNDLTDATLSDASNDSQNDSNINEVETKPVKSIVGPCQEILKTKECLQNKNKLSYPCVSNDSNHFIDSCGSDDDMDSSMVDLSNLKHQLGLPNESFVPLSPLPPSPHRKKIKSSKKSKTLVEMDSDKNIKSTSKFSNRLSGLDIDLKPVSKENSNLSLSESIDQTSKPFTIQNSVSCEKTTSMKKLEFSFSTKKSSITNSLEYQKTSFNSHQSLNDIKSTSCEKTYSFHNPLKVADPKTPNNKSKIKVSSVSAKRYSDGYIKLGVDASKLSRLSLNLKGRNVFYPGIVFQETKIYKPNTAIKSHVTSAPLLKKSCMTSCKEENLDKCAIAKPNIIKEFNPYCDVPAYAAGLGIHTSGNKCIMSTPLSSATNKIVHDSTIPLKKTFFPIKKLQNATDPVLEGKGKKPASSVETSSMTLPLRVNGRTFQSRAFCKKRDKTENAIDETAADTALVTSKEIDLEMHVDSTDIVCPRPRKVRKEHKKKNVEERHKDNSALQNQNCSGKGIDVTECVLSNNEKLHNLKTFNQSSKCLLLKSSGKGVFDSDQNEQLNSKETLSKLIQPSLLPEIFSQNILDVVHNSDAVDRETPDCLNNAEFSNCKEASSPLEKYTHLGLDSKCSTSNNLSDENQGDSSIKTLAHSYNEYVMNSTKNKCRERSLNLAKRGKKKINGTYTEYLQSKRMLQDQIFQDPVLFALKTVEQMRSTDLYSKHVEQSLINALIDPKYVAGKTTLLFRVFQYLNTSKMKPLAIYLESKDYSVLLPVDENCIVSVLFKIEEKNKVRLHKLLFTAINTLHQLILAKEHFDIESLSSFCRVFTEICKRKRKPQKPLTLCLDLLKMKHKYAPYLIAAVAGVWKELFEVSDDISDEEKVLYCAIAYGAAGKRPKSLHHVNWQISKKLLSEFFTVPDISDIQQILEFLFEKIHEKCINGLLSEIEYSLITPLIICAVHTEWSWTREHVLDKHIIPSLMKYGKELNERAFDVFCNIYANIFSFCPGKPRDEILNKYFERNTKKVKCSVRDSAALALIKIAVLQRKVIPDVLIDWYQKNQENPIIEPIKFLFLLRTISGRKKLTQNDILLEC